MRNNKTLRRFEIDVGDKTVFADYRISDEQLFITHVETPLELRGQGAAAELMEKILEHAKQQNLKIISICSYAAAWMKRQRKT